MLFFYIRHGDPIYRPDSLTALGEKQADALAKRLALYGLDKIYASTSNRAMLTAKPTCDLLKMDMELLDFTNESHAWQEFTVERNDKKDWIFADKEYKKLFMEESVSALGYNWYQHKDLEVYKKGMDRISKETFELFKSLGYEKVANIGKYKVLRQNDDRVALFAHAGFGTVFLSEVLGIPLPLYATHYDFCHSGMTVIEFREEDGFATPYVLTHSSDSHLYREGLPTKYCNRIYF